MLTLFIMALQSTLFGPSLRGTIPELYPAQYVVTANAVIRMLSTGAILAGIALAGIVLDVKGFVGDVQLGRVIASCAVVVIAIIGVLVSFGVPKFPAASQNVKFPWSGPFNSIKTLYNIRKDSLLTVSITAKAFFWFIGSLNVLVINQLGLEQFGLTNTLTSVLFIVELAGIATGSLLSTKLARGEKWYRVLCPSAAVIAVCMFVVAIVPEIPASIRKATIISALGLLGVAGGVFSVPLASFVQVRPRPDIKGRIIAASSFADFTGILISGGVFYLLNDWNIKPSNCFAVKGIMTAVIGFWLFIALRGKKIND
jgi:acyl-[acyl-carrier-protein]-phospholipid O-acyltransferase/long-chain-fatty-acid--[acyl-carrier-protein] ligase